MLSDFSTRRQSVDTYPAPGWMAVIGKKRTTPDRRDVENLFRGRESLGT